MEGDYSLNSPHSGAYGTSVRPAIRQGQAPGPRAACGDLGRRPTLPNPHGAFSPRKGGFAQPFHPHSQGRRSPLPLHPLAACPSGTKEGTSLSGHSKARTTRRLSLHPLRRLGRFWNAWKRRSADGPKQAVIHGSACCGAALCSGHSLPSQSPNASGLTVGGMKMSFSWARRSEIKLYFNLHPHTAVTIRNAVI